MTAFKTRIDALEAVANRGMDLCHIELLAHDDPRAAPMPPINEGGHYVTRVVLIPLKPRRLAGKEVAHGNA
jgi:hypothetical protein